MAIKQSLLGVLLTGVFGSCNNMSPLPDYSGYKPAIGEVTYVYEARLRRQGYHAASYRVKYMPPGADKPTTVDGNLVLKSYKRGDSVNIFYNPANTEDAVTDKIN